MFRFTIRDLLWLMVVVGLAVGWWVQERRHRADFFRYELLVEDINSSGVWQDSSGRVLQIGRGGRRNLYKITPFAKDPVTGNYGAVSYP